MGEWEAVMEEVRLDLKMEDSVLTGKRMMFPMNRPAWTEVQGKGIFSYVQGYENS